jgi:hypothetical protein
MNPMTDGYLTQIAKLDEEEYMAAEKGMLTELLSPGSPYGPVSRLWFDGVLKNSVASGDFRPGYLGTNYSDYYDDCFRLIRTLSPQTLISSYRGDVCANTGSLYTNDGPQPNGTNSSGCTLPSETGMCVDASSIHRRACACAWHVQLAHADAQACATRTRARAPELGCQRGILTRTMMVS